MSRFEQVLTANAEELLKAIYRAATVRERNPDEGRSREIARVLGLNHGQLVCAVGFNANIQDLPDVVSILGFPSYDVLARSRDRYLTNDVYERLSIKDILAIYAHVHGSAWREEVLQHLLPKRLHKIEEQIETTVNPLTIERYKREVRAIYGGGIAWPEFAEQRLKETDSGFRSLLGEVRLIVENRIMPVGAIFFRDDVLPEEKRRLIVLGLAPRELIATRLLENSVPPRERQMLEEQARLMI